MGTFNIIESSLKCESIRGIVAITTDKVYKNVEKLEGYVETDALGGKDPYSASKSASEMVITAWQEISNINKKIPIVSVRSGNVIDVPMSVLRFMLDNGLLVEVHNTVDKNKPHMVPCSV
jgi:CDP-glucose 4,6-dehydratase